MSVFLSETDMGNLYVWVVATEITLNFYKYQTALYKFFYQWTISAAQGQISLKWWLTLTRLWDSGHLWDFKGKGKVLLGNISKTCLLLLLEALTSESFSLQSLSYSSNGVSQRWP